MLSIEGGKYCEYCKKSIMDFSKSSLLVDCEYPLVDRTVNNKKAVLIFFNIFMI